MGETLYGDGRVITIGADDGRCQNRDDNRRRCRNDAEPQETYCSFCLELVRLRGQLGLPNCPRK